MAGGASTGRRVSSGNTRPASTALILIVNLAARTVQSPYSLVRSSRATRHCSTSALNSLRTSSLAACWPSRFSCKLFTLPRFTEGDLANQ